MLRLGVHVSIAGKIYKSVDRAAELGCNTMQIFSRSPRQWRKTDISQEDADIFKKRAKEKNISPIVVHIPYTLNLASCRQSFHKITIKDFIADLLEVDKLGADYLVTHMGSYKGGTELGGLSRIVNALKKILKETKGVKTMVLLENTSGSGSWLGYKFSHQKFIFDELSHTKRVGLCLDTAHAWAAGYKINDAVGLSGLLREIDREVGLERVKVIHINDTLEELDSRHDRHFAIGEGKIGKRGFSLILNHPKLKDIPFILETPRKDEGDDQKNIKMVRQLYKG
ncbi:MAG: deoxyribonuclease IV [Candidatus Omnitrophica bacterium]|nr:deoxyribonuclease IV [Candidatus Omnitrophota bacterium]